MDFKHGEANSFLKALDVAFYKLDYTAPEARKPLQQTIAANLNRLAELAGLKPIALGGIPLEDDNTITTIGEIPT